jgi:hypothetical protein
VKNAAAIVFLLLFPVIVISAQELFVTSRIGPLSEAPDPTAPRVGVLRQGESVERISEEPGWYHVQTARGAGYIQAQFVGDEPPVGRVAQTTLQDVSSVSTRRRASAYTTSAAATRGLSAENIRERENLSFDDYDFKSVRWVSGFTYGDDELLEFAESEGLGL